jgi:hypothetical protein
MRPIDRFPVVRFGAVALLAVVLAQSALPARVAAQTPPGEVVPPGECTTAPRPVTFLADLIATPAAAVLMTTATAIPEGTEPDEQTRQEITAVIRQLIACTNTGDILRPLALYDDDYLRRVLNAQGQLTNEAALELVAPFATPIPIAEALYTRLVEIREMRLLGDGRVAALVISVPFGGGDDLDTDLLFFARTADGWIIDDAVSDFVEGGPAATPTA